MKYAGEKRIRGMESLLMLPFAWYAWITVMLLAGSTLLIDGIVLGARGRASNPFDFASAYLSASAREQILADGFTCRDLSAGSRTQRGKSYCTRSTPGGILRGQFIELAGDQAREIIFSLEEHAMRLGDLVLLWGKPEIQQYCEVSLITWPEQNIWINVKAVTGTSRSYFAPVVSVSFTQGELPGWVQILTKNMVQDCSRPM